MQKRVKHLIAIILFILPNVAFASQAGVVIKKQDGTTKNACVSFDTQTISGWQLLQLSGFNPVAKNGFVIQIDGEGSADSSQISAGDPSWTYWKFKNGWQFQNTGATYDHVANGDVEGWQFSESGNSLPTISLDQICQTKQTAAAPITASNAPDTISTASTAKTSAALKMASPAPAPSTQITQAPVVLGQSIKGDISSEDHKTSLPEFNLKNVVTLFVIFITVGTGIILLRRKNQKSR